MGCIRARAHLSPRAGPHHLHPVRQLRRALADAAMSLASNADAPLQLTFGPGSRLMLAGDSTLHRYAAEATALSGTLRRSPEAPPNATIEELARKQQIASMRFTIPVERLRSGEGRLDRTMWKALETEAVTFTMERYTVTSAADRTPFTVEAQGTLVIARGSRPVTLQVQAVPAPGSLRVTGVHALRMSDYGITPPTFMGGLMKARDEVTVQFDLRLVESAR